MPLNLRSADSFVTFVFTPTSLLPNHALITDVQQIEGSNGQQWIKCTKGRGMGRVDINTVVNNTNVASSLNTVTIGSDRSPLMHFTIAQQQDHRTITFQSSETN